MFDEEGEERVREAGWRTSGSASCLVPEYKSWKYNGHSCILCHLNVLYIFDQTCYTGWVKHKTPTSFGYFLRIRPWIFARACRAFNEWIFFVFFFVRYLGFCIVCGYLGLNATPNFRRKKGETIRKRLCRGTLNMCAKFQGLSLKNGVDI